MLVLAVLVATVGAGALGAQSAWGATVPTSTGALINVDLLPQCSNGKDDDGDGKIDIVAVGRATKNAKIYWNQGK